MSNLLETITELRQDLVPIESSREEYLASCARDRIDCLTAKYDKEFDKLLSAIEVEEMSSKDIISLASNLKKFSGLIAVLQNNLIEDLDKYSRNLFSN